MRNKIVILLTASLLSLNAMASISPTNQKSVIIDSLSTPDVKVVKDSTSINMNNKILFNIEIYSESLETKEQPEKTGVYSKDSPFVNLSSQNPYKLEEKISLQSYEGASGVYSKSTEIPINKSLEVTSKKDGSIETTFTPDYISVGRKLVIDKRANVLSLSLSETNLNKWRKYKSEFGVVDLPDLYQWNTKQRFKLENEKVLRIESPVYKKDGKIFRTIYLIEAK